MATALRPWVRAASMRSRNGSQALAVGARPGGTASVDTAPVVAGCAAAESVDTSPEMAGFAACVAGRPWAADRQPRRLQIGADRLAAAPGRLFDAPERPSQAPKRQDLLSLLVAQDVAHPGEGPCRPCRRQRLSRGPLMAGFQVSINGRFWVSPEDPGTRLGPYEVTALIGEGGMGQVYQATDTKLNRQVALKILPEAFSSDPDRLARFQREAQVLASLNHPNIAAIYGLEEADDTRALVLELVEGPTLADRIAQGPIPLDEALPIAKQNRGGVRGRT